MVASILIFWKRKKYKQFTNIFAEIVLSSFFRIPFLVWRLLRCLLGSGCNMDSVNKKTCTHKSFFFSLSLLSLSTSLSLSFLSLPHSPSLSFLSLFYFFLITFSLLFYFIFWLSHNISFSLPVPFLSFTSFLYFLLYFCTALCFLSSFITLLCFS